SSDVQARPSTESDDGARSGTKRGRDTNAEPRPRDAREGLVNRFRNSTCRTTAPKTSRVRLLLIGVRGQFDLCRLLRKLCDDDRQLSLAKYARGGCARFPDVETVIVFFVEPILTGIDLAVDQHLCSEREFPRTGNDAIGNTLPASRNGGMTTRLS